MIYWDLFLGFLQVGLFSFGGAYGAIPLIREVVLSNKWLSDESLTYMIAVSESTPGPIMVNLATYVGNSQAGLWGAIIATTAVVLPAFFVILIVMVVLKNVLKNKYAQAMLRGVKPCIIGIILATGLYIMAKNCFISEKDYAVNMQAIIMSLLLGLTMILTKRINKKKISPITLIVISAFLGIVVYGV